MTTGIGSEKRGGYPLPAIGFATLVMPTGIHTEPDNLAGKAPLDPTSLLVARADLGDPLTHRYTHELPLSATGCLRAAAANRLREMPDVS